MRIIINIIFLACFAFSARAELDLTKIYGERNFFGRNDSYLWDASQGEYSKSINDTRPHVIDLPEALKFSLQRGFPTKKATEELYRARIGMQVALGGVIPELDLKIGATGPVTSLVAGLLRPLMPHNWLELANSATRYNAGKYDFLTQALDQYTLTKALYYDIHREIRNLEIVSYYREHTILLAKHVRENYVPITPDDKAKIELLESYAASLENVQGDINGPLQNALISYARVVVDDTSNWATFNLKAINLHDEIVGFDVNKRDEFMNEALKRSPELKMFREYVKIAKRNKFIEASRDILSSATNDKVGVAFGSDIIPKVLIVKSREATMKINLEEALANMHLVSEEAILGQNRSFGLYDRSSRIHKESKQALAAYLDNYINQNNLGYGIMMAIDNLMRAEMFQNIALHTLAVFNLRQQRLEVLPIINGDLFHDLPNNQEIERLRLWFADLDEGYVASTITSLPGVSTLKTNVDLENYFSAFEVDQSGAKTGKLLEQHMDEFLRGSRNTSYYKSLENYIRKYDIHLTAHEQEKLSKKKNTCGQKFASWFLDGLSCSTTANDASFD